MKSSERKSGYARPVTFAGGRALPPRIAVPVIGIGSSPFCNQPAFSLPTKAANHTHASFPRIRELARIADRPFSSW